MLGIAGPDDADFPAMLAFGSSVIRLADIARHSGRAADAVSELWPLITRLETRVAAGHAEAETMRLLAQARVSFGVAGGPPPRSACHRPDRQGRRSDGTLRGGRRAAYSAMAGHRTDYHR